MHPGPQVLHARLHHFFTHSYGSAGHGFPTTISQGCSQSRHPGPSTPSRFESSSTSLPPLAFTAASSFISYTTVITQRCGFSPIVPS